jgi:CheY-like chemotaxis protein
MLQARTKERQISLNVQIENLVNNLVFTDSLRLNQVIINLLSNAVKFSPKGGEVKLVVREEGSVNGISTFRFEVIDRGLGISEQQAAKLFRPFEQSDGSITRNYGGTGLGLAISKNLVEMMGGVVGLESEINRGSTFWFTIVCPARTGQGKVKAEDTHNEETRINAASLDFSGKRCLVVDDVDINREIILEILGDTRLEMETAANGKEALEMFARSSEGYYDLILMDMQMPVLDGCSASREIRRLDRADASRVPIIAMTANVLQEDIRRVLDAGMNAHLGKPIDMQAMFAILREYLGR